MIILKIVFSLIMFLSLFLNHLAFAASIISDCEELSVCPATTKVNGPVSSFFSKVTGMNLLVSGILESQIKKQMDKALDANFKIDIVPFGAKTLLNGEFKSFTAHSDYMNLEGLYLSNINAESLCSYNHFVYKDNNIYTAENFLLGFSADITSSDLQKTLMTEEYQGLLNSMNVSVAGVTVLKVFNPIAKIEGNKLHFSVNVISPMTLGKTKTISTTMTMLVDNGKIMFTDLQTSPKLVNTRMEAFLPLLNNLNPFTIKAAILENKDSSVKIKKIDFVGDKIVIKGLVIVPKNYYNS